MLSVQMCVGIGFSGVDQHMEAILDVSGKAATVRTRDNPLCCPKLNDFSKHARIHWPKTLSLHFLEHVLQLGNDATHIDLIVCATVLTLTLHGSLDFGWCRRALLLSVISRCSFTLIQAKHFTTLLVSELGGDVGWARNCGSESETPQCKASRDVLKCNSCRGLCAIVTTVEQLQRRSPVTIQLDLF